MGNEIGTILDGRYAAVAFEVAMNQVGPRLPIDELLPIIDTTIEELTAMMGSKLFQSQVMAYKKEFEENGVSFMAKAKIAAEDCLKELYTMAHDADEPASVRRQCIKDLVEYAGWGVQAVNNRVGSGTAPERFSIQFIMNGQPVSPGAGIGVTIEGEVE